MVYNHDKASLYLFINGAQRKATFLSDVAHQAESAFEVAVAVEAKDSRFFFVCLATGVGTCSDLAATTNVQKDHMYGGSFVHVEVNESVYVCGIPCRRDQLAQAVADAMK